MGIASGATRNSGCLYVFRYGTKLYHRLVGLYHMQTQNSNGPLLQSRPYPNLLTLVIPIYNEASVVPHLRSVLDEFMTEVKGETEIVLVNDGSTDSTLGLIA